MPKSEDTFQGKKPDAVLEVTPPPLMMQEYWRRQKQLQDDFNKIEPPKGNWINHPHGMLPHAWQKFKLWREKRRLQNELFNVLKEGARLYLPELSRQQLFGYLHSFQRLKDWFNYKEPGLVLRKIISFCGPPVVKHFQIEAQKYCHIEDTELRAEIQATADNLKLLRKELERETLPDKVAKIKTARERKAHAELIAEKQEEIEKAAQLLEEQTLGLGLKDVLTPLLNEVPAVAFSQIKPEMDRVTSVYNQQFPDDPIVHVAPESLGAGSVAQTHEARTRSGGKRIIKVFRPEANESYFKDYKRFSQFLTLFLYGKDHVEYAKHKADEMMEVFQEEIRISREKVHAEHLKARLKKEGYQIAVPQVLATTERGFVEEFAEGPDLASKAMKPAVRAEAMQTLGPMLVKSYLLYPEKYLDPQGGNLKWPAAIFDYGRMGLVEPKANQKILKFMQSYLLASIVPYDGPSWQQSWEKRRRIRRDGMRALVAHPVKQPEELDMLYNKLLHEQLDAKPARQEHSVFGGGGDSRKRYRPGYGGSPLFRLLENLPVLSKEGAVISLGSDGQSAIRVADVAHAREKLQVVMAPYFEYAGGEFSDETLLNTLAGIKPAACWKLIDGAMQDLWASPVRNLAMAANDYNQAQGSLRQANLAQIRRQYGVQEACDGFEYSMEEAQKLVRESEKIYKKTLLEMLDLEEARDYLVKMMRIDKHLQALAEDLGQTLLQDRKGLEKSKRDGVIAALKYHLASEFRPYEALT